ncbi:MAG TPA: hypothetical protein VMT34_11535, partial [Aggregatilineales bacterium]|nr:hypothetical protein [Aggregatilineales bacterium]
YSPNRDISASDPGITVLEHVRAAFTHLESFRSDDPDHKLLKIGDGDWDDGIVIMTALKSPLTIDVSNSIRSGESVPNSQMALHVLPLMASLVENSAPDLAARMRDLAAWLKDGVTQQWNPDMGWFNRALLRDADNRTRLIGDHHISLQSQVWPLITGLIAEMGHEQRLIENVMSLLDDPSPTGAMLESKGQVWPAVSQLLTWGYQRCQPELAWRSLNRHTFAAHGSTFPNVWFNIWSGPDGTNSRTMPNAGGTWASVVTPMTDFPVTNANQDAMALLGLLRVCGIEPSMRGDGLDIHPQTPPERYVLQTQLLSLDVAPGRILGDYCPIVAGRRIFHVHVPPDAVDVTASVGGVPTAVTMGIPSRIDLQLDFAGDRAIPFEVRWRSSGAAVVPPGP